MRFLLATYLTDHRSEAASILSRFKDGDIAAWVSSTDHDMAVLVLQILPASKGARVVQKLKPKLAASLFTNIHPERLGSVYWQLAAAFRNQIKPYLSAKLASYLREHCEFSQDQVGRAKIHFVDGVLESMPIIQVAELFGSNLIRTKGYFYVVSEKGHLVGVVRIKDVFFNAARNSAIKSIMLEQLQSIGLSNKIHHAILLPIWHSVGFLPVVDELGIFVGVVTLKSLSQHLTSATRLDASAPVVVSTFADLFGATIELLTTIIRDGTKRGYKQN